MRARGSRYAELHVRRAVARGEEGKIHPYVSFHSKFFWSAEYKRTHQLTVPRPCSSDHSKALSICMISSGMMTKVQVREQPLPLFSLGTLLRMFLPVLVFTGGDIALMFSLSELLCYYRTYDTL
ncbi:hypothetical protein DL93DRAFT_2090163 [Clavulina sp. PMI_390]|nr:hypothetical protein DL93DRAFT_2090163 [Clavulina sp. PMI_390]